MVDLGYNDRIDELRVALGVAQLKKLEHNNNRWAELTHAYWQGRFGSQHLPRTEDAPAREVTSPLYFIMRDDVVHLVAGVLMQVLQHQAVGL